MATQFIIEKNVTPPAGKGGFPARYPFREMETGDSFFVATDAPNTHPVRRSASMARMREQNKRFSCRKVEGGLRIWRIA